MSPIHRVVNAFARSIKFWLGFIVIAFGLMGFLISSANVRGEAKDTRGVGEAFYQTFQLFILESGIEDFNNFPLEIARVAALLLLVATAFSLLTRIFQESYDSFRLPWLSKHTIVCGLGRIGQRIVDDALAESSANRKWYQFSEWTLPKVVVIEADATKSRIRQLRTRGVLVVVGDATDEKLIESIGLLKAMRLIVATGNDETNIEVAFDCINLIRSRDEPRDHRQILSCFVQLTDPTISRLFSTRVAPFIPELPIDLRVFNPATTCARQLIESDALLLRPKSRDEVGLFILIGFGRTGQALALQIAELAHFENGKRQRMLIVDDDITKVAARFNAQFSTFTHSDCMAESWGDVRFDPAADDWQSRKLRPTPAEQVEPNGVEYVCNTQFVESPKHFSDRGFTNMLQRLTTEENVEPILLVCRDQDRENFDIAAVIADALEAGRTQSLPIFVWLPEQSAIRTALNSQEWDDAAKCRIIPFGSCADFASMDNLVNPGIESLAEKLHQQYQQEYCGDNRSGGCANWASLPEHFRQANRSAAVHALIKCHVLQSFNTNFADNSANGQFEASTVELLAEMEHNRWMAERMLTGWRYGPQRDDAKLLRPSILAWKSLPSHERDKDVSQVRKVIDIVSGNAATDKRQKKSPE